MGTPQGISLTEARHPFTFLVSEDSDGAGLLSRDEVEIAPNNEIVVGHVLARQSVPANVTETQAAGTNTGNGALTLANPAVDNTVKGGNYRIVFTDATHFLVEDPEKIVLGEGVVGTAWANGLKFTIAAGGTAFAAGDSFVVNVDVQPITDEQYVPWVPGLKAVAIAGYPVRLNASLAQRVTVINAHATVRLADLTFGGMPTAAQIDQAKRDLAEALIKFR
jgi:hypothetical protein